MGRLNCSVYSHCGDAADHNFLLQTFKFFHPKSLSLLLDRGQTPWFLVGQFCGVHQFLWTWRWTEASLWSRLVSQPGLENLHGIDGDTLDEAQVPGSSSLRPGRRHAGPDQTRPDQAASCGKFLELSQGCHRLHFPDCSTV